MKQPSRQELIESLLGVVESLDQRMRALEAASPNVAAFAACDLLTVRAADDLSTAMNSVAAAVDAIDGVARHSLSPSTRPSRGPRKTLPPNVLAFRRPKRGR